MFPFARIFGHDTDYPPLFTTLPPILVCSGFFAASALLTHLYVKRNGPIPFATPLRTLNNTLYALFSFYFAIQLTLSVYSWARLASFRYPSGLEVARSLLTETLPGRSDMRLRYIYHISKFYEFIDIILMIATGGDVGLMFGFHHMTTPYLTYARCIYYPPGWQPFAILNTFHHGIMYARWAGISSLIAILPYTAMLQLGGGVLVEAIVILLRLNPNGFAFRDNDWPALWPNVLAGGLLATYLVLLFDEIKESIAKRSGKEEKKKV
ncbi:hypothetical protein M422DRAFT_256848 [Sphaerobolus stellatus SS14]|uniref:Very-long-chain 3-oxoacyl-CoA synthase n=1 Tax=Sphaerobolus stellatus (strain SS14) TaxID=990650 RepID=A0A0C9UZK5_SPHS4|nr:hypothetical protein M422DRAFT_256848 [Sphaerobolus stellatus SS14]